MVAKNVKSVTEKAKARAGAVKGRGGKHANGFMEFIRTQGVVGLAVGLAVGTAAGDTVKKLVDGFINPIIQFIVGSQDALNSAVWRLELWGRSADFAWGPFVSSAITLLATALVIYLIINVLKLDRLDKKKD
jgi:large conductance mechanosensitive channel